MANFPERCPLLVRPIFSWLDSTSFIFHSFTHPCSPLPFSCVSTWCPVRVYLLIHPASLKKGFFPLEDASMYDIGGSSAYRCLPNYPIPPLLLFYSNELVLFCDRPKHIQLVSTPSCSRHPIFYISEPLPMDPPNGYIAKPSFFKEVQRKPGSGRTITPSPKPHPASFYRLWYHRAILY